MSDPIPTVEAAAALLVAAIVAETRRAVPQPERIAPMFLTITEACEALHISRNALNSMFNRGDIGSRKVGRRRMIPRSEIERIVNGGGR